MVANLQTRDKDTIETVEAFRQLRGYGSSAEALDKLVQRAKEAGLLTADSISLRARETAAA